MIKYHREFMGHKLFINDACDHYESVPVRTHRKKRLRKKFLKKYGWRETLVSDMLMTKDGNIIIGPKALQKLLEEVERHTLPGRVSVCGS
jgi:hypothetical protein